MIRRLDAFYSPDENDNGDFPDEEFGLGDVDPDLLEQGVDLLILLETTRWSWPLSVIQDQDDQLMQVVLRLLGTGAKLKIQNEKQKKRRETSAVSTELGLN